MNERIGKKLKRYYWAVADKGGELVVYGGDTVPMLFPKRPWLSKVLGEKAVKVTIVRYEKEVL